jgi:hypothetical protein
MRKREGLRAPGEYRLSTLPAANQLHHRAMLNEDSETLPLLGTSPPQSR